MGKKKLSGTCPEIKEGATSKGKYDAGKTIKILITLRSQMMENMHFETHLKNEHTEHLDHDTFAKLFGASQEDIEKVKAFAQEWGIKVEKVNPVTRSVVLSAPVEYLNKAFDVDLYEYEHPDHPGQTFHTHKGDISIPEELHGIITSVFGLHGQPVAKRKGLLNKKDAKLDTEEMKPEKRLEAAVVQGTQPHLPPDIAKRYNFPTGLTGKGQSIAIMATNFTGFYQSDLEHYFKEIVKCPMPNINVVEVDGVKNEPGKFCGDIEATEDIEILGAIAPGAEISVYFTELNQFGIISALHQMIENKHSIISMSWFSKESEWKSLMSSELKRIFFTAAKLGITVCVSSGDKGAYDGVNIFSASPFVLSCGGTEFTYKEGQPKTMENIDGEVAWNDVFTLIKSTEICKTAECTFWGKYGENCPIGKGTRHEIHFATGGGESDFYERPEYQSYIDFKPGEKAPKPLADTPGRLYPDLSGYAPLVDPGVGIYLHKRRFAGGGTSGVAPLYAALFGLINERLHQEGKKSVGFVNQKLYELAKDKNNNIFNDITSGDSYANGVGYGAGPGWDACCGLGTVDGTALMNALLK